MSLKRARIKIITQSEENNSVKSNDMVKTLAAQMSHVARTIAKIETVMSTKSKPRLSILSSNILD